MNTTHLRSYAPAARRAFIAAASAQAARLGITARSIKDARVQGDVLVIEGQAFPASIAAAREALAERVRRRGFAHTMEAIAYTWFNRIVAIRYMEVHGYLEHGFRVLSHPDGSARPEILDHTADVDLPGLDREKAIELKLDGKKDEELYRLLLLAQCNALHQAMPFLFEKIGDETELLLPANLLHTDSLIRQLVESIDENLWQEIEIIGWLYQFYISEKKDQVIGKVVKSEDIPAATQLFTPNWIVKYMVQNSLGAQWLATYPQSPLKGQMEYYIEPAEQTDEVNAQLAAITPSQLYPETMTLIDPACGSGHILVEASELFKAIYLERGYRQRDVPQLILEKNLFGLDIDERAAQLTGFALMMKGRADDRRLFERGVKLNVMALVDSAEFDAEALAKGVALSDYGLQPGDLTELKRLFEHATTFGSLIQVPEGLAEKLPALKKLSEVTSQDLFVSEALNQLRLLVQQSELLAAQYDAVVANPPYMSSRYYCGQLKAYARTNLQEGSADLYAAFIARSIRLAAKSAFVGMITIPNWMFLSSFETTRKFLLAEAPISTLVHNGRGVWGSDFGSCSFVLHKSATASTKCRCLRLFKKPGSVASNDQLIARFFANKRYDTSNSRFAEIPGNPIAYWAKPEVVRLFSSEPLLGSLMELKAGLSTGNNDRFQRHWHEVSIARTTILPSESKVNKWAPCQSGGEFRKWFGNEDMIVDWEHDGASMRQYRNARGQIASAIRNERFYFRPGITWTKISSGRFAARVMDEGFVFDDAGRSGFVAREDYARENLVAVMVSNLAHTVFQLVAPGMSMSSGELAKLPCPAATNGELRGLAIQAISIARWDWYLSERSWGFSIPGLRQYIGPTLEGSFISFSDVAIQSTDKLLDLECRINRLINQAATVATVKDEVPRSQISLRINPAFRYAGSLTSEEQWARFRQDTMEELVSYAIGCMMGRYSLDEPGLIYAHSGNEGFDPSKYTTFPADDDGIVPLTDTEWFDDDAANRLVEFISVAWDTSHLEANLTFLADNLNPKKNESSRETLRRYLCDSFFKDHLQTYKKRPIYWLFSSGKQKAFQCLVYLHRYNEGTLSRMRSEYVIPLQGKMSARLDKLQGDIRVATSTAQQKRLEKERAKLAKQQVELLEFDEKLRHYADMRISLDLDDGVKVNYGKFGDLLAEVKAVTGKKAEDE